MFVRMIGTVSLRAVLWGDGNERLPDLAARWAGDADARPYVAPRPAGGPPFDITVSLGVGENPTKRLSDDFERQLLRMLAGTGASVLVDKGGSAAERERVERALPPGAQAHDGPFAPFAAEIVRSKLFVGYDSAGRSRSLRLRSSADQYRQGLRQSSGWLRAGGHREP